MSKFFDAIEDRITTENGAATYSTSKNDNLDFFALGGAKRNCPEEAVELFKKAFYEDYDLALKNLFYLRDVRHGKGERKVFQECMKHLCDVFAPELITAYKESKINKEYVDNFKQLIIEIPEYGSWKDVFVLYGTISNKEIKDFIENFIFAQIENDLKNALINNPHISLCAKWFPLPNNTINPEKRKVAKVLAKKLFNSEKICRQTISYLRKYLNVCEQKISAKNWNDINYSAVPAKAALKYRNAFMKNDYERYAQYLNDVRSGKTKINAATLYPYELVNTYSKAIDMCEYSINPHNIKRVVSACYDTTIEELWNHLPNYCQNTGNAICVVDVSGSMTTGGAGIQPISVAISLGLYFAERNTSIFKNKFITFSENPSVVTVKGNTLIEKIINTINAPWGLNTNIKAVFDLILKSALKYNLTNDDMPETIYIISDMEFDECIEDANTNSSVTVFECIDKKYKKYGYKRPNLVFWNVASRNTNIPVRFDEAGTMLVSGASPVSFKIAMERTTPFDYMIKTLSSERYKNIHL